MFANRAAKLTDSYLRYLENVIRKEWPAPGVPFRMSVRGKPGKPNTGKKTDQQSGWAH
jgi:GTP-binding protein